MQTTDHSGSLWSTEAMSRQERGMSALAVTSVVACGRFQRHLAPSLEPTVAEKDSFTLESI